MPPIEHAIIGGVLCWRYLGRGEWRVSNASALTGEIVSLRAQCGLQPYSVLEDEESIGPMD